MVLGTYVWLVLAFRYPGKMRLRTLVHCVRADAVELRAKARFTCQWAWCLLLRWILLAEPLGNIPQRIREEWRGAIERESRKQEWSHRCAGS